MNFQLFILLWFHFLFAHLGASPPRRYSDNLHFPASYNPKDDWEQLVTRLDCHPPESRTFAYASETKLWGKLQERIFVRADVEIHCMGQVILSPDSTGGLTVVPNTSNETTNQQYHYNTQADYPSGFRTGIKYMAQVSNFKPAVLPAQIDIDQLAPPQLRSSLEDNIESATVRRLGRAGFSTWVSGVWNTFKDWFAKVVLNQLNRTGKGPNGREPSPGDSDDKNRRCANGNSPKSWEGGVDEFDTELDEHDDFWVARLSRQYSNYRGKRRRNGPNPRDSQKNTYDSLMEVPFEFVQTSDGQIPMIWFSDREKDVSIKNFKRHLTDAFATQLNKTIADQKETSPIGEHITHYARQDEFDDVSNITDSGSTQKMDIVNETSVLTGESFLVQLISTTYAKHQKLEESETQSEDLAREDPLAADRGRDTITVIRDIAEEDVIHLSTDNAMIYDPNQVKLAAKQIQHIQRGQLTSTTGHLHMSLINPNVHPDIGLRPKRSTDDVGEEKDDLAEYLKVSTTFSLTMVKRTRSKRSVDLQSDTEQREGRHEELGRLSSLELSLNLTAQSMASESRPVSNLLHQELMTLTGQLYGKWPRTTIKGHLLNVDKPNRDLLDYLEEVINLEYQLSATNKSRSLSKFLATEVVKSDLESSCSSSTAGLSAGQAQIKLDKCIQVLSILSKVSNKAAIDILEQIAQSSSHSDSDRIHALNTLTYVPWPTSELIYRLIDLTSGQSSDPNGTYSPISPLVKAAVITSVSSLAGTKETVPISVKLDISRRMLNELNSGAPCLELSNLDILEGLGNLGVELNIDETLFYCKQCTDPTVRSTISRRPGWRQAINEQIIVGCIHAHRKLTSDERVQAWLQGLITFEDHFVQYNNGTNSTVIRPSPVSCLVKQEVMTVLTEAMDSEREKVMFGGKLHSDPITPTYDWPLSGLSEFDAELIGRLSESEEDYSCLARDTLDYLGRKVPSADEKLKAAIKAIRLNDFNHLKQTTTRSTQVHRAKREVYTEFFDEAYCSEWPTGGGTDFRSEPVRALDDDLERESDYAASDIADDDEDSRSSSSSDLGRVVSRKKCTATKYFGPPRARTYVTADIINDAYEQNRLGSNSIHSATGKQELNKLTARFKFGGSLLGRNVDISHMYVNHWKDQTRAYINIFGKTLLDTSRNSCNGQPYRYTQYLPFYDFNVWLLQVTLGMRLTGEVGLNVDDGGCTLSARRSADSGRRRTGLTISSILGSTPGASRNGTLDTPEERRAQARQLLYNGGLSKLISLRPDARLKAAGEATGKVMVARAGMTVGGDFNYWADLKLNRADTPLSSSSSSSSSSFKDEQVGGMCITATNGHQPMSVNVASWYQMWDVGCEEWGERLEYSPQNLVWNLLDEKTFHWMKDECFRKRSRQLPRV